MMRRWVLLLLLFFSLSGEAVAQYRITARGCVQPGDTVTILGRDFGSAPNNDSVFLIVRPTPLNMQIRSWSSNRIRVMVPRSGITAGSQYDLLWRDPDLSMIRLGAIQICDDARGAAARMPNRARAARDVVPAPDGSPEYIVSVDSTQAGAAASALQGRGATLLRSRPLPQLGRTLLIFAFPGDLTLAQARAILANAAPSAEIDLHHIYGFADGPRLYATALIGDDPERPCRLSRPVKIGLIDGPLNTGHPALAGLAVSQVSVLAHGERPVSTDHGTAVAGLIASNPASGYTGFASGARLYAAGAFSSGRGGSGARLENVAAGLDWLAGQGVRIVNLSMEGSPNTAFEDVLNRARRVGLVLIAAAGNERTAEPRYPAASPSTIGVTAVDAAGRAYSSANSGPHIEFAAPGVDLYVARPNGGGYRSGTSYAAPIVTALVARRAAQGGLTLDGARSALRRSVRDLGPAGRDPQFGYGLVQAGGC